MNWKPSSNNGNTNVRWNWSPSSNNGNANVRQNSSKRWRRKIRRAKKRSPGGRNKWKIGTSTCVRRMTPTCKPPTIRRSRRRSNVPARWKSPNNNGKRGTKKYKQRPRTIKGRWNNKGRVLLLRRHTSKRKLNARTLPNQHWRNRYCRRPNCSIPKSNWPGRLHHKQRQPVERGKKPEGS